MIESFKQLEELIILLSAVRMQIALLKGKTNRQFEKIIKLESLEIDELEITGDIALLELERRENILEYTKLSEVKLINFVKALVTKLETTKLEIKNLRENPDPNPRIVARLKTLRAKEGMLNTELDNLKLAIITKRRFEGEITRGY